MLKLINVLSLSVCFQLVFPITAFSDAAAIQRKIGHLEKRDEQISKDKSEIKKNITSLKVQQKIAVIKLKNADPKAQKKLKDDIEFLKNEISEAELELEGLNDQISALDEKREKLTEKLQAAEDKEAKDSNQPPNFNCPDGSCNKKVTIGYTNPSNQSKGGLELMADVAKTAIPSLVQLGLGVYGINQQSNNYQLYNNNNTKLGLPSSAPTDYSSLLGSMYGMNSNIFGSNVGYNPYNNMSSTSNMYGSYNGFGLSMGANMYTAYNSGFSNVLSPYSMNYTMAMSPYSMMGANISGYSPYMASPSLNGAYYNNSTFLNNAPTLNQSRQ